MFSSLDTNNYEFFDPFDSHQTTMLPSFTTQIQSPSSYNYHTLPSFLFSSNFHDNVDESLLISQFLLQQQNATEENVAKSSRKVYKNLEQKKKNQNCIDGTTSEKIPRRRIGKKRDRHSKICTAQGTRDRRMRLSLQIARKFFDLQDMLGFDKASKTIEWLLSKSKTSIKQLKESVAASGGDYEDLKINEETKDETLNMTVSKRRTKTMESSCKTKESREKARKRARERTLTKLKMRLSGLLDTSKTFSDLHQETRNIKITSGAQIQEVENQEQESSMVDYKMDSVSIIEKFLGLSSDSSSEESYKTLSSIRDTTSTRGMVIPKEHNITSVEEEGNNISYFSLYDYLC